MFKFSPTFYIVFTVTLFTFSLKQKSKIYTSCVLAINQTVKVLMLKIFYQHFDVFFVSLLKNKKI